MSCFALYRLPHEHQYHRIVQHDDNAQQLPSVAEVAQCRGFVLAPFEVSAQQPVVVIRPDEETMHEVPATADAGWGNVTASTSVILMVSDARARSKKLCWHAVLRWKPNRKALSKPSSSRLVTPTLDCLWRWCRLRNAALGSWPRPKFCCKAMETSGTPWRWLAP